MFILDQPYVSEFLKESVISNNIPVLKTPYASQLSFNGKVSFIKEEDARKQLLSEQNPPVYSNSENAIEWIASHCPKAALNDQIERFKNKVRFREMVRNMDPSFYFQAVPFKNLDQLDVTKIPKPFIIKPAIGFFSLGVFKVFSNKEWPSIKSRIQKEVARIKSVYPTKVLDTENFIIEQNIEGEEYAFDAYFNDHGEAVILSLLKHLYASEDDVGDRVYISSKKIIENKLSVFEAYLNKIGEIAELKNFPLHVEVRVDKKGVIRPIEINPMRFGGWCTTADMTWFAYGLNPYTAFHLRQKPNWQEILEDKDGLIYSNIVLTNTSGFDVSQIKVFNYDKLKNHFRKPLELRQANYKNYLIFGFLFAETLEDDQSELEWILKDDLKEFITV